MFTTFHHLGVRTKDISQAIRFYQQAFGFERGVEIIDPDRKLKIVFMNLDGFRIELLEYGLDSSIYPTEGVIDHLAFVTSNLNTDFETIVQKGWKCLSSELIYDPSGRDYVFFLGTQEEKLQLLSLSDSRTKQKNALISEAVFEHISLQVSDLDRSVQFYTEVLGFKQDCKFVTANGEKQIQFVKGYGIKLELVNTISSTVSAEEGIVNHMAFIVDDIEESVKYLDKNKVMKIHDTPQRGESGIRYLYFRGPDAEKIEIIEQNSVI